MDEKDIKNNLLDTINNSSLSEEDKQLWQRSLEEAPQAVLIALHGFFVDFPDKLEESTSFLKRKIHALESKDPKAWNAVLQDEELSFTQSQ